MKFTLFVSLFFCFISCKTDTPKGEEFLTYSTTEAALKSYRQGWVQIMDEGRYEDAEASYRLALDDDPNFLVGKSVLARLTLDVKERLKLYEELEKQKQKIQGDERLVFDVYMSLVKYTNLRDLGSPETKKALNQAMSLSEKNLRKLVHKYPKEVYLKSEYVEFLHSIYGPQQALDSLMHLTDDSQRKNPFLLGYSASMHAELGEYELAMSEANRLLEMVNDSTLPKTYAVLADVYFKMGNLEIAKKNVDKAHELDSYNLDASRLKTKIDQATQVKSNGSDVK